MNAREPVCKYRNSGLCIGSSPQWIRRVGSRLRLETLRCAGLRHRLCDIRRPRAGRNRVDRGPPRPRSADSESCYRE